MNSILCLLVPSVISIKMYQHINGKVLHWKDMILDYFLFVFFNHFFTVMISIFLFDAKSNIINSIDFFPIFALKYCLISIILCFILPIIFQMIKKNIDYRVEVKKNEKNSKKSKKDH